MPPQATNEGGTPEGELPSRPIRRVGSMGDISVEGASSNEKVSNVYTTRKSTLIGYVLCIKYILSATIQSVMLLY